MDKYGFGLELLNEDIVVAVAPSNSINYFTFNIEMGHLCLHNINVIKVLPQKDWFVNEHYHTFFELHIIPDGKGKIKIENNTFDVCGGQFYLTGPYIKHTQISDTNAPMTEYCIKFQVTINDTVLIENSLVKKEVIVLKELLSMVYPFAFKDTFKTASKFDRLFVEAKEHALGYKLKIQLLLTEIIIDVMRTISLSLTTMPSSSLLLKPLILQRVERIENYINSNFNEPISIDDLSKLLFLSARQINRIMKKELNMSFHDYLLNMRFNEAKKLLRQTCLTIEEIALSVGFSSANHLYQVFKKNGISNPSHLRKEHSL